MAAWALAACTAAAGFGVAAGAGAGAAGRGAAGGGTAACCGAGVRAGAGTAGVSNTTVSSRLSAELSTRCAVLRERSIDTSVTSGDVGLSATRTRCTGSRPLAIGLVTADDTFARLTTRRRGPSFGWTTLAGTSGPVPRMVTAVAPSRACTSTSWMVVLGPSAATGLTAGASVSRRSASTKMTLRALRTRGRAGCDSVSWTRVTRAPSAATAFSTTTAANGLRGSACTGCETAAATTSRSSMTNVFESGCDAT